MLPDLLTLQPLLAEMVNGHWVHDLDPVLFEFTDKLKVRWYGLSYVAAFIVAAYMLRLYHRKGKSPFDPDQQSTIIMAVIIGTFVGGRMGYILLYDFDALAHNPMRIFYVWEGGMSSHGGIAMLALVIWWISRHFNVSIFKVGDILSSASPAGIFLVRVANFINGELWGKVSDVPWAVIFPGSAPEDTPVEEIAPRHPSQLYEAALEGLVLFAYLQWRFWNKDRKNLVDGQIAGEFFIGYALLRIISEIFREPDDHVSLILGMSRGTFYSLFMIVAGVAIIYFARRRAERQPPAPVKSGKGKKGK